MDFKLGHYRIFIHRERAGRGRLVSDRHLSLKVLEGCAT
jgi:hypothetical protein